MSAQIQNDRCRINSWLSNVIVRSRIFRIKGLPELLAHTPVAANWLFNAIVRSRIFRIKGLPGLLALTTVAASWLFNVETWRAASPLPATIHGEKNVILI
jgi:hypothetical protein